MEFIPATLSNSESGLLVDKIEKHFLTHGFGLFAAELRASRSFIGYIGLAVPSFEARFTPCVEVGWRLSAIDWGKGLATEGAREVLRYAFGVLKLDDVVSFTVLANARSGRLPRLRRTGPGSRAATRARLRYIAMAISRQRRLRKNSNAIGNNGGSIPSATAASE